MRRLHFRRFSFPLPLVSARGKWYHNPVDVLRRGPSCARGSIMISTRGCNRAYSQPASQPCSEKAVSGTGRGAVRRFSRIARAAGLQAGQQGVHAAQPEGSGGAGGGHQCRRYRKSQSLVILAKHRRGRAALQIDAFREIGMYVGSVVLTRWRSHSRYV